MIDSNLCKINMSYGHIWMADYYVGYMCLCVGLCVYYAYGRTTKSQWNTNRQTERSGERPNERLFDLVLEEVEECKKI